MTSQKKFMLTGCSSGIGRHLVGALSGLGHQVFATDVDTDRLAEVAQKDGWPSDRVHRHPLDVRDEDAWGDVFSAAVDTLEGVDVLGNIAGVMHSDRAHAMPSAQVHLHVDVNLKGVIFGTQTAARYMVERGEGHIFNIASMAGRVPLPGLALYCATKFGVRAFSIASAGDLRPFGVKVTVLCPDAVDTPMVDRQRGREVAAMVFSAGKLLTVEQIADAVIRRVLPNQPLEVFVPRFTSWTARFCDCFPRIGLRLAPLFEKRGKAEIEKHDLGNAAPDRQ